MMKAIAILLIILLLTPVLATDVGELVWTKDLSFGGSNAVNSIDTDESGDVIFAGLSNGSVVSYNAAGDLLWRTYVNGSVLKVKTISDGSKVVVQTDADEAYFINGGTGSIISTIFNTDTNITAVDIARNGSYFMVTGNRSMSIYNSAGVPFASNHTFDSNGWTKAAFDPYGSFIIATSLNKTYRWNLSLYTGWPEMNYAKDERNQSNVRDDGFQYRIKITSVNTSNYTMMFLANSSLTTINCFVWTGEGQKYWFNNSYTSACGRNFTIRNYPALDDAIVGMDYYSDRSRNFSIGRNNPEVYIYYNNATYMYPTYYGSVPS